MLEKFDAIYEDKMNALYNENVDRAMDIISAVLNQAIVTAVTKRLKRFKLVFNDKSASLYEFDKLAEYSYDCDIDFHFIHVALDKLAVEKSKHFSASSTDDSIIFII